MKQIAVADLMVPLEEYVNVLEEATLFEAVMTLEKAQEELDRTRYKYLHRAILVSNKKGEVVGKIGQLDILKALEPKYKEIERHESLGLGRAGLSPGFLQSMMERYSLWERPMSDICTKAAKFKVKDFMHTPSEGEYVEDTASLDEAIHHLVIGQHQSLLVTHKGKIVGILRLTDVFLEIFRHMKACQL